ncbi:hypothetical protein, partial [Sphingomonas bacterium]|uniref:hypothetical protein n=1 Tax=Sphingomonas bacterium TaxID=1895847 RepID=UPI0015765957
MIQPSFAHVLVNGDAGRDGPSAAPVRRPVRPAARSSGGPVMRWGRLASWLSLSLLTAAAPPPRADDAAQFAALRQVDARLAA